VNFLQLFLGIKAVGLLFFLLSLISYDFLYLWMATTLVRYLDIQFWKQWRM